MNAPLAASIHLQTKTIDRLRRAFLEALHLNLREEDLPYEQRLDEITGFDSIAVLEFIAAVEKEFGVTVETESLELRVLGDLRRFSAYIDSRLSQARG